jgi:ribosomal protein S18 acetylase RimI-like enzyme
MIIRPLSLRDLDPFVAHCHRHMAENGAEGDVIFGPSIGSPRNEADLERRIGDAMATDVGSAGWLRAWGALDDEGRFMGHCDLRERGLDHTGHRCLLGMGVLRPYRRRGLGTKLLEAARDWARAEGFAWIDLYVLTTNPGAQQLYQKLGFVEVGRVEDFFRTHGLSLGDIAMTLKL